ncbi:sensor histidine kinase [uncultured Metabacillus sp.]|uniref:sensor histidine kinase n=1 Tax=uncultured Metabacillus sp. TaxID=2860135 RepID=UPI002639A3E8|nr:sensor histidine kinase [uncultured Metabacillus sp.]
MKLLWDSLYYLLRKILINMISKIAGSQWWRPKNYQLRMKLIITYILLTLIPMTVLVYFSYHQYTKLIEEQVGENIPKILDQTNKNMEIQMSELEDLPQLLYNSNQVLSILRKDSYSNQSTLQIDYYKVNSYLSLTYLTDKSPLLGVFLWSKERFFSSSIVPYSGLEKTPDFKENESIVLQDQVDLRFKGKPSFFLMTERIEDFENRKEIGTLAIAVNLSFIEDIFKEINNQNKADMWIMNGQGKVIYHTDPERIGTVEDLDNYPTMNGSFRSYLEGEKQLVSVSESEKYDWVMVHRISMKHLTGKAEVIKDVTILFFVIIGLGTVIISIILAWGVSRPIYKLSKLMKDVEKGNFDVDLKVDSKDEIGLLANSFNSMISKIRELIKENFHIEIRQKQAELYALQSQINPHFMYNTLETISMAVEDNDDDTVVEMVTLLGRMLRFSLSNKNRIVPFNKEVEHIKNYLTIQQFRFEERLSFHILSEIDLNQLYSPKFILQPIIENCIKHGLETRRGTLTIRIYIRTVPGIQPGTKDVVIYVEDDGAGIDDKTLEKINSLLKSDPIGRRDSGFGMINVHGRIFMLFGEEYGLTVESGTENGTVIMIRFPVIEGDEEVKKYERKEGYFNE